MFANTTLSTLMMLLSIPLTDSNVSVMTGILSGIETLNNGAFVAPIETLIGQIIAIQNDSLTPTSLNTVGMVKADVVEWQRGAGAGAGAITRYKELMSKLRNSIGLQPIDSGVSMYRSDRYSLTGGSVYQIYDDWRLIAW